jgi:hypothetical protein
MSSSKRLFEQNIFSSNWIHILVLYIALVLPSLNQLSGIDPDTFGQPITCPNIEGIGDPVYIFHKYFQQTISIFNPKEEKTKVELIYYRRERVHVNVYRFIFKLRNSYADRWEYVGILSVVPKNQIESGKFNHFIIRYINSTDVNDAKAVVGVYEAETDKAIPCKDMKQKWLSYILKNPYVVTKCEAEDRPDCVTSNDLTLLFSDTFELIEGVLASFGFKVSTSQLGYDPVILSIYKKTFSRFDFANVLFNFRKQLSKLNQLLILKILLIMKN